MTRKGSGKRRVDLEGGREGVEWCVGQPSVPTPARKAEGSWGGEGIDFAAERLKTKRRNVYNRKENPSGFKKGERGKAGLGPAANAEKNQRRRENGKKEILE